MNRINAVFCLNCGTDTGLATINKDMLEELEYSCSLCGDSRKANEGIIRVVDKNKWQDKLRYQDEK